ncbi:protease complex subunit PrcB family protein [Deinococcus rubellus]|uniref:Protease complex subunit PrcB family protein n=1 Tax=Deinococcus rubellus TaxID=1889240 RepID=A0ABY5YH96_9DEIO|nr:protease complex subunit PrcB family protein [Deinococcus rubellus]UWX63654.1 protease complex subunit PrcB family protein [Deinococcus rubellus]
MKKSAGIFSGAGALLGAALLSGCTMQGAGNLKVHEVLFYGSSQDRLTWVYGSLTGGKGSLSLAGQTLELRPQISDPLGTPGSLSVGGRAVYKSKTSSALPRSSVVQQGMTYTVSANQNIAATYLVTGGAWYRLSGALAAGSEVQATAQPVGGLSGAGQLTASEASVLSSALGTQGTFTVTVLPADELPDAPLAAQPAPTETLRTGLYLQPLSVITSTTTTTTTNTGNTGGTVTGSGSNAPVPSGTTLKFREVASGSNALASTPQVKLASSQDDLGALWNSAYGRQVPVPPTPIILGQTAVGIFLGNRPTGGYGVTVQSVSASGSALNITVNVRAPGPGSITTQSITSPWTIVAVQGQFASVTVRDQNGQRLGQ